MAEWRTIEGKPKYEVCSDGRVRNAKTGRILKTSGERYAFVSLGYNGNTLVHRLVATAFLGKPGEGHQVNHKNGDRKDNRVENLEWVTPSENTFHSRRVLRQCLGEKHGLARLTWERVDEIRNSAASHLSLAREYGVSGTTIQNVRKGIIWREELRA